MLHPLLTIALALLTTAVSYVAAALWHRARQNRLEAVREQARHKMTDYWARQALDGRTLMLDGDGLRHALGRKR